MCTRPRRPLLAVLGGVCAILVWAAPAAAQDGEAAVFDVSAIGIDVARVQQGVQRGSEEFTERDGRLNLTVFVNVFGQRPPLNFLPSGVPNAFVGLPPGGPPTHADMMRVRTPREFSGQTMDFGAAIQWLRGTLGGGSR